MREEQVKRGMSEIVIEACWHRARHTAHSFDKHLLAWSTQK